VLMTRPDTTHMSCASEVDLQPQVKHVATIETSSRQQLPSVAHVSDRLPWSAWILIFIAACERFAYYAFAGPLRVYSHLAIKPEANADRSKKTTYSTPPAIRLTLAFSI
jgi:dipeptide/tripeptide permease